MSYQQTEKPRGFLYHYTTRDHLEDILRMAGYEGWVIRNAGFVHL